MFYLIILSSIILPLISKNKDLALKISICLLFIIWGLQYGMTNDWPGYIRSLNDIINSDTVEVWRDDHIKYEPIYVFIVKFFKPIGIFGYMMFSALFALYIIYKFTKKYVPKEYYWLTIYILTMMIEYMLLFINSIRQSQSLFTTLIATCILFSNFPKNNKILNNLNFRILLACLIIFIATKIHRGANFAYILIPIYIISQYSKPLNNIMKTSIFIFANFLFILRFFFDFTFLQDFTMIHLEANDMEFYSHYAEEFDSELVGISLFHSLLYWGIMNIALLFYTRLDKPLKYFALSLIIALILKGFMANTLGRLTQYLYIYMIFLIPNIIPLWNNTQIKFLQIIKKPTCALFILYTLYSFLKSLQHPYYSKWNEFETFITAPEWM